MNDLERAELIAYVEHQNAGLLAGEAIRNGLDPSPWLGKVKETRAAWGAALRAMMASKPASEVVAAVFAAGEVEL